MRLSNWKNFREATTRLQDRMFLVGPNASGKSNFRDVFRFLRDLAATGGGLDPDYLADPKATVVQLARQSRQPKHRQDLVPRPESRRSVERAYALRLSEFARLRWRPDVAETRSDSLRRTLGCLRRLVEEP